MMVSTRHCGGIKHINIIIPHHIAAVILLTWVFCNLDGNKGKKEWFCIVLTTLRKSSTVKFLRLTKTFERTWLIYQENSVRQNENPLVFYQLETIYHKQYHIVLVNIFNFSYIWYKMSELHLDIVLLCLIKPHNV